jgi:hypothetical protein
MCLLGGLWMMIVKVGAGLAIPMRINGLFTNRPMNVQIYIYRYIDHFMGLLFFAMYFLKESIRWTWEHVYARSFKIAQ